MVRIDGHYLERFGYPCFLSEEDEEPSLLMLEEGEARLEEFLDSIIVKCSEAILPNKFINRFEILNELRQMAKLVKDRPNQ